MYSGNQEDGHTQPCLHDCQQVELNACSRSKRGISSTPLNVPRPSLSTYLHLAPNALPCVLLLGEHLRICPQGYTCCTSDMEDSLAVLSRREMEGLLKEAGRSLHTSLTGQYKAFDGEFYYCQVVYEFNDEG